MTTNHLSRIRRDIECATSALMQTEALWRVLNDAANEQQHNPYIRDALAKATALHAEMEGDLEDAMERAIAAGFDPEDFA